MDNSKYLSWDSKSLCKIVINKNFVGILINLLEDLHQEVVANAVWGLGNIAADSQENRFMLMNLRVV